MFMWVLNAEPPQVQSLKDVLNVIISWWLKRQNFDTAMVISLLGEVEVDAIKK